MRNAALAGAIALAMMGSALADETRGRGELVQPTTQAGFVLTEAHIVRLKSTLNLTPNQARHWPAVEAALRDIARLQAGAQGGQGLVRYYSRSEYQLQAASMNRLVSVAMPLIETLDDDQKREALRLARAMGLHSVPASF